MSDASAKEKREARLRRHRRVRQRVSGTADCPRLAVFRSLRHVYAQLIDDTAGVTLAAASSLSPELREAGVQGSNIASATAVGRAIAEKAAALGIQKAVFDRGGYQYHGRVKALAEAAREAGLDLGPSREPKNARRGGRSKEEMAARSGGSGKSGKSKKKQKKSA